MNKEDLKNTSFEVENEYLREAGFDDFIETDTSKRKSEDAISKERIGMTRNTVRSRSGMTSNPAITGGNRNTITVREVAKILSLSQRSVYRLIENGELTGFKLAKEWRIYESSLDNFIASKDPSFCGATVPRTEQRTTNSLGTQDEDWNDIDNEETELDYGRRGTGISRGEVRGATNISREGARGSGQSLRQSRGTGASSRGYQRPTGGGRSQSRPTGGGRSAHNKVFIFWDEVQDIDTAIIALIQFTDEETAIVQPLPLTVKDDTDTLMIAKKNGYDIESKITIKKYDKRARAVFATAELDESVKTAITNHYDTTTGKFNWDRINEDLEPLDSGQLLLLSFLRILDNGNPVFESQNVFEIVGKMDVEARKQCLEAISILFDIDE